MSSQHGRDEAQARWILARGWVSQEHLREALHRLPPRSPADLCSHLLARKLLSTEQVAQVRRATRPAHQTVRQRATNRLRRSSESQLAVPPSSQEMRVEAARPVARVEARSEEISRELRPLVAQALSPGRRFRDYEILSELGRGAMGVVYLARQDDSEREVVLKFMQREAPDETEVARFRKEAQALIALRHPNIVEITDAGSEGARLFYAMEHVRGETLEERVLRSFKTTGQPPEPAFLLRVMRELAEALEYIHEQGILHRDIKPANILIEAETERAVLVDFGLLKRQGGDSKQLTKTGELIGTPAYMSPEQFSPGGSFGDIGLPTDVWAWGAVLYFGLRGEAPFVRPTIVEIFQAIMSEEVPRLEAQAPPWVCELTMACLSKVAGERPSIGAVLEALDRHEGDFALPAEPGPRRFSAALLLLPLLALAIGLGLWLSRPATLLGASTVPARTAEARLLLSGQLSRGGGEVWLGEQHTEVDAEGAFRFELELSPGPQTLELRAGSATGPALERWSVVLDTSPPKVEWEAAHVNEALGALVVGEDLALRGRIIDDSPTELHLSRQAITPDEEGRFTLRLNDSPKLQPLKLEMRDALGHEAALTLKVATPLAREELDPLWVRDREAKPFLEGCGAQAGLWRIALDRKSWEAASAEQRAALTADLAERLGEDFEATRLEPCGELPLPVTRHRASGVVLHMIPGGVVSQDFYERPYVGRQLALLEALVANPGSRMTLLMALLEKVDERLVDRALVLSRQESKRDELTLTTLYRAARRITLSPELQVELKRCSEELLAELGRVPKRTRLRYCPPLLLARHELTLEAWQRLDRKPPDLIGAVSFQNQATFHLAYEEPGPRSPVQMTQLQATAWLSRAPGLRLPSYEEWRLGCLAGLRAEVVASSETAVVFPEGFFDAVDSKEADEMQWVPRLRIEASPASVSDAPARANGYGLRDTLGNLEEWVKFSWEAHDELWPESPLPRRFLEALNDAAVAAGGSILNHARLCRSDIVAVYGLADQYNAVQRSGLRVAASIPRSRPEWGD